ncbi:pyruvate dehydrogenase [acetyl-transferring]-phosphatase 1, mitochondrial [Cimex lectularius]|uniref:PPM-type phosphatase domain-containing protein n=1 Tax=Cimex lectularius TaxID=79782 RepID=A0A8I6TJX8_CIMLE|nr:pyruvate dehydrogenase [acetyl-transferring]-phosphatase 1, mitochondrial [Cimex lectularius]
MALGGRFYTSLTLNSFQLTTDRHFLRPALALHKLNSKRYSRGNVQDVNIHHSRLSPMEVTSVLRANEFSHEFSSGPVKSYDSNQLASNNPMEDMRAEAKIMLIDGLLMGVFDGHAGAACAQVLAKRLLKYVAVALLPQNELKEYAKALEENRKVHILETYNDRHEFINELKEIYTQSFKKYVLDMANQERVKEYGTKEALESSFLRLDDDISREALDNSNTKLLGVCMSGAVACLSHISKSHLHVANVGDCQAVLGVLNDGKVWSAKKMSIEHNSENPNELDRLFKDHPDEESYTLLEKERLFGQLIPLRAFGDFRYKWSKDILEKKIVPLYGPAVIPPRYNTPPYLTAKPEIMYHRLTPKDKFLVIASDGLWDLLSPLQVVRLVGEHMSGKAALTPLRLPNNTKLKDIHKILVQRREGLNKVPIDKNAATHLFRNALGGTDYGIEHSRISQLLSLSQDIVRLFRDDITVTVIYFDSDFISHCPM